VRDYMLMFIPVGFYFIAKLLRYWMLVRDDQDRNNVLDYMIHALWIIFILLSLPISIVGFLIDSLYSSRELKRFNAALRFVRRATQLETMSNEKRRAAVAVPESDRLWAFPGWVTHGLQKYGVKASDLGFRFSDSDYE